MFDNTIIVFTADNGGQVLVGGNNYPLRGNKHTIWEGGTRSSAFVYASFLKNKGSTSNEMIHVVDWLPTLLSAVKEGLGPKERKVLEKFKLGGIDGVNQWHPLKNNGPSNRKEFLYNIDPLFCDDGRANIGNAGIRIGEWKLLVGNPGTIDGWIPPAKVTDIGEDGYNNLIHLTATNMGREDCNNYTTIDGKQILLFNIKGSTYSICLVQKCIYSSSRSSNIRNLPDNISPSYLCFLFMTQLTQLNMLMWQRRILSLLLRC